MDMSGMGNSSTSNNSTAMMSTAGMSMTFFISETTSLWLQAFTPSSEGGYAGAVIGLILLGLLNRAIAAGKCMWTRKTVHRTTSRQVQLTIPQAQTEHGPKDMVKAREMEQDGNEEEAFAVSPSGQSDGYLRAPNSPPVPPFKWRYDFPRTILAACEAFTSYLLMLGVMTYNVGYFFSVITGIFIGELVFGRYVSGTTGSNHLH